MCVCFGVGSFPLIPFSAPTPSQVVGGPEKSVCNGEGKGIRNTWIKTEKVKKKKICTTERMRISVVLNAIDALIDILFT